MRLAVGETVESAERFLLGSFTSDLHAVWSDLAALASLIAVLIAERSAVDMAAMLERDWKFCIPWGLSHKFVPTQACFL